MQTLPGPGDELAHRSEREPTSDLPWDRVWVGAHLATMDGRGTPYGALFDGALAVKGDRIAWIGTASEACERSRERAIPLRRCEGLWILPGLIDCHTHLVYGGNRVAEYERRLCGATYEDISRSGGGIQATVDATRAADAETLLSSAMLRARRLMAEGVTTLEVKSGYGLDFATERRMLEVARELARRLPLSVRTTYLGLHALPREYRDRRADFIAASCGPWLEELTAAGLVDAVDAFCESIGFTLAETELLLRAAQRLGLKAHLHAGQLTDLGAAELAARYGALSADHLECLSAEGTAALAASGIVAVLLPGAYYMLRQSKPPPVPLLREAGVAMAVATDSNPGTSPCTSLLLALNMACTLFGLTPEEAVTGVTRHAARALGVQEQSGTLEVGKRADFALYEIDRPAELCYGLGANPCLEVVYGGIVCSAAAG